MQRIGEFFSNEYKIVKPGHYNTFESITRAIESAKNGLDKSDSADQKRAIQAHMRMQAFIDLGIKLVFDNAHFITDQPENSDQEIKNIYSRTKKFFSSHGICVKTVFVSTKNLGLDIAIIRIPSPNQQALKSVFSGALLQAIENNWAAERWFEAYLPDPILRQKNLDKLADHSVNVLIDVCNEFDIYVELADRCIHFISKSGELKPTQSHSNSSNLLIPRVESLLKWVFIDPKTAFNTPEELQKGIDSIKAELKEKVALFVDRRG